jgi:hypothetical protein
MLAGEWQGRTLSVKLSITHISGETEFKTDLDIC